MSIMCSQSKSFLNNAVAFLLYLLILYRREFLVKNRRPGLFLVKLCFQMFLNVIH